MLNSQKLPLNSPGGQQSLNIPTRSGRFAFIYVLEAYSYHVLVGIDILRQVLNPTEI